MGSRSRQMRCVTVPRVVESIGREGSSTDQADPFHGCSNKVGCVIRPPAWAHTKCSSDGLNQSFGSPRACQTTQERGPRSPIASADPRSRLLAYPTGQREGQGQTVERVTIYLRVGTAWPDTTVSPSSPEAAAERCGQNVVGSIASVCLILFAPVRLSGRNNRIWTMRFKLRLSPATTTGSVDCCRKRRLSHRITSLIQSWAPCNGIMLLRDEI